MNEHSGHRATQSGISYVEILAAIIVIAAAVVPASDALRSAFAVAEIGSNSTVNHFRLVALTEAVLADPFTSVAAAAAGTSTASSYSDPSGTTDRRVVYISNYDGDNADADDDPFTGTDADLLWIRAVIEGDNAANGLEVLYAQ